MYSNYFNSSQYFKIGKQADNSSIENSKGDNELGLENSASLSIFRTKSNKRLKSKVKATMTQRGIISPKNLSRYTKINLNSESLTSKIENKPISTDKLQKSKAAYLTNSDILKYDEVNPFDKVVSLSTKNEIAPPRHTISQAFSSSEIQKETSKKYQAFLRFKNDLLASRDSISKNDCSNISPFCSTKDLFDLK